MRPADRVLIVSALLAGALLVGSLPSLWPLPAAPLAFDRGPVIDAARALVDDLGYDTEGYASSAMLTSRTGLLDELDRSLGRDALQALLADGLPAIQTTVRFKRRGAHSAYTVHVDARGPTGFTRVGPRARTVLEAAAARRIAEASLPAFGLDADDWTRDPAASTDGRARDHRFGYERTLRDDPQVVERLTVRVSGGRVTSVSRTGHHPVEARRAAAARRAPQRRIAAVGAALAAVFGVAALGLCVQAIRRGAAVRRALLLATAIFAGLVTLSGLQSGAAFAAWDPASPRWVATAKHIAGILRSDGWQVLLLPAVVVVGDLVDRREGAGRAASLWRFLAGRWTDPDVAAASIRGLGVALVGGGALALAAVAIDLVAPVRHPVQPRSLLFLVHNAASPALAALLLAANAALVEEIAYRLFGIGWLRGLGIPAWAAVGAAALVFGLTHASAAFLPVAEPLWGRAAAMTAVGVVWGVALLKYDVLTVVLGHCFADLVFFLWPRLASGDPSVVAPCLAVLAVPLVPALLGAPRLLRGRLRNL